MRTTKKQLSKAKRLSNKELVAAARDAVAGYASADAWVVALFHEIEQRLKDGPYS